MDDEDEERLLSTPAQVQADLLRMLVPPLLSALERMTELQQYHMFNDAAEHVADLCDSPAPQQDTISMRYDRANHALTGTTTRSQDSQRRASAVPRF